MAVDPVEITFPDVHPRVGVLGLTIEPGEYPIHPTPGLLPDTYGALYFWPRSIGTWFTVQAEADALTTTTRFGTTHHDLLDLIRRHGADTTALSQEVREEKWARENWFLFGSVTAPGAVRLKFRVDTNNERFVMFAEGATADGLEINLNAVYFDGSASQPDSQTIRLLLQPATPVRMARVLLAVDLGNTSTTAALLDPFDREGDDRQPLTQRLPMLTTRPVVGHGGVIGATEPGGKAIPSELRFDRFRSWVQAGNPLPTGRRFPDLDQYPDDDRPNAVDYVVGELARSPGTPARSVVMGAKRMGSSRPLRRTPGETRPQFLCHPVSATHRIIPDPLPAGAEPPPEVPNAVINVDVRAPLELLACRVFQHFREAQKAWPAKIALTYPTTYSRFELQSLRRAVQKGWLRMQAARLSGGHELPVAERDLADLTRQLQAVIKGPLDLDTQAEDPVIQLLLDEASAAAFFHLYRKIFEQIEGGLAGFRYLHPNGLNMLLYDCGGGTTDIALVRAVVEADVRTLRITVLRRSGVRTFGGDDITRHVCRLLKAKIAHALATNRRRPGLPPPPVVPPKPPTDREKWAALATELNRFINAVAATDPQDQLVPTRSPANQAPTEERRAAALALWRLGELLKVRLASDDPPPGVAGFVPGEVRLPPLERDTSALTRAILSGETQQVAQLKRQLEAITITRTEIDALIYEPVMRSITNCNKLIQSEFDDPGTETGHPQEVHWVVASGNAIRYPLLQRLLRKHLAVAFLDDEERFTFDPDNAKDATAKGAVLALASMEGTAQQIDPQFDSDLADRLPFNVGFMTMAVGRVRVLFAEHTPYRNLKEREPIKILLPEMSPEGVQPNQFVLLRQFPGDERFEKFLAYEFPDGIQGQHLLVSYDDTYEFEFRVVDGTGVDGIAIDLAAGDIYRAPAQRGDI